MGRALAIDLGSRRIGVAVSDALGMAAHPLKTIERYGGQRDLDAIGRFVKEYGVERIVVGLPLNPEPTGGAAEEGRAAKGARAFAARLEAAFGLPVELVDESFSTVEAESVLLEADLSRARRKQVIDQVAAAVILQRWLKTHR
jgi:putative Holliday junction resolvase